VAVLNEPITKLGQLSLSGAVLFTGVGRTLPIDIVTLSTGSTVFATSGENAVNVADGWTAAEFNVFGDGGNEDGGGQASFNSGSTVVPRTRVFYGGTEAPSCIGYGFTGETNNLSFGPTAPAPVAWSPGPGLVFSESSAGGAIFFPGESNCVAATTLGPPAVADHSHNQCLRACNEALAQCMSRARSSHERQECISDKRDCIRSCR
jgi:hypothetical protein